MSFTRLMVLLTLLLLIVKLGFAVAVPLWLVLLPISLVVGAHIVMSLIQIALYVSIYRITKGILNNRKETH